VGGSRGNHLALHEGSDELLRDGDLHGVLLCLGQDLEFQTKGEKGGKKEQKRAEERVLRGSRPDEVRRSARDRERN
jgi:hypothetical protein